LLRERLPVFELLGDKGDHLFLPESEHIGEFLIEQGFRLLENAIVTGTEILFPGFQLLLVQVKGFDEPGQPQTVARAEHILASLPPDAFIIDPDGLPLRQAMDKLPDFFRRQGAPHLFGQNRIIHRKKQGGTVAENRLEHIVSHALARKFPFGDLFDPADPFQPVYHGISSLIHA